MCMPQTAGTLVGSTIPHCDPSSVRIVFFPSDRGPSPLPLSSSRERGLVLWHLSQHRLLWSVSWQLRGEGEGLCRLDDAQVTVHHTHHTSLLTHITTHYSSHTSPHSPHITPHTHHHTLLLTHITTLTTHHSSHKSPHSSSLFTQFCASLLFFNNRPSFASLPLPSSSLPVARSWIVSGSDSLPSIAKSIRPSSTLRRERREDEPLYDSAAGIYMYMGSAS